MCLQMCENSKVSVGGELQEQYLLFKKKLYKSPVTRIGLKKIKESLNCHSSPFTKILDWFYPHFEFLNFLIGLIHGWKVCKLIWLTLWIQCNGCNITLLVSRRRMTSGWPTKFPENGVYTKAEHNSDHPVMDFQIFFVFVIYQKFKGATLVKCLT